MHRSPLKFQNISLYYSYAIKQGYQKANTYIPNCEASNN